MTDCNATCWRDGRITDELRNYTYVSVDDVMLCIVKINIDLGPLHFLDDGDVLVSINLRCNIH